MAQTPAPKMPASIGAVVRAVPRQAWAFVRKRPKATGAVTAVGLAAPIVLSVFGASPFAVDLAGFNALGSAAVAFLAGVHVSGDTERKQWSELTGREKYGEVLALVGLGFAVLGFGLYMAG